MNLQGRCEEIHKIVRNCSTLQDPSILLITETNYSLVEYKPGCQFIDRFIVNIMDTHPEPIKMILMSYTPFMDWIDA